MKYFAFTNFWAMVREKAIWIPLHSKKKEKKEKKVVLQWVNELYSFDWKWKYNLTKKSVELDLGFA